MRREVHHADALKWLRPRLAGTSVITSLPDVSELPGLGFDGWRHWFVEAARASLEAIADEGVAVFFQSDIRREGAWIDKAALVTEAASGYTMLFHKIAWRLQPGTATLGRASYAHLLAFARRPRPLRRAMPDVLEGGPKIAPKAMGREAAVLACELVRWETPTRTVLDPFCGFGTVLAVANALGLDAVGVDSSARMVKKARALQIDLSRRALP